MKQNRKTTKRWSTVATNSTRFGAIIGALFVMVILNLLASSSCQQLSKSIGEGEKILSRLEDECRQECNRWDSMKTPEKLQAALLRHGLKMAPAHPNQNIHMKADGTPYPCIALARSIGQSPAPVAKNSARRGRR